MIRSLPSLASPIRRLLVGLLLLMVAAFACAQLKDGNGGGTADDPSTPPKPAPVKPADKPSGVTLEELKAEMAKIPPAPGFPVWAAALVGVAALASLAAVAELLTGRPKRTPAKNVGDGTPRPDAAQEIENLRGELRFLRNEITTELNRSASAMADLQTTLTDFLAQARPILNPELIAKLEAAVEGSRDRVATLEAAVQSGKAEMDAQIQSRNAEIARLQGLLNEAGQIHQETSTRLSDAQAARTTAEQALATMHEESGTERVAPSREAIESALARATAKVAGNPAAERVIQDDVRTLTAAIRSVETRDARGAMALLAPLSFDPFLFPEEVWTRGIAAKRTLESAREAILAYAGNYGFEAIRPRPDQDRYVQERHGKAGEIEASRPDQAGLVARLRRPGLAFGDDVIQPAQVDKYVYDPARALQAPVATEAATLPGEPAASTPAADPAMAQKTDDATTQTQKTVEDYFS